MSPVVEARAVGKRYVGGDGSPIIVLDGLDLAVEAGEFVAIVGASGAGKSTLLHLLGALDTPTTGEVWLEGRDVAKLAVEEKARIRNERIGFVFQFHHLLRDFKSLENVMMPLLIAGLPEALARTRAAAVLGQLGLAEREGHYPSQLSGGEQQRVAIARAVAPSPAVVLADEPSGNLDPHNGQLLHQVLADLRARFGTALVVATHNPDLAARADRILRLAGGRLTREAAVSAGAIR
jgi:lipoprotein-releasing system ATP-binding protein